MFLLKKNTKIQRKCTYTFHHVSTYMYPVSGWSLDTPGLWALQGSVCIGDGLREDVFSVEQVSKPCRKNNGGKPMVSNTSLG